jgi:hypothetical protein
MLGDACTVTTDDGCCSISSYVFVSQSLKIEDFPLGIENCGLFNPLLDAELD